jgi:hypothetical protein
MMPTTRKELDAAGCDMPDCGHDHSILYFHGRCHPASSVDAYYEKGDGLLHIRCHTCGKPISNIKVAER